MRFFLTILIALISQLSLAQIDCPFVSKKYNSCMQTRNPVACETILIKYYTAGTNYDLNSTLRNISSKEGCKEIAPLMLKAFSSLPKSSLTVFRGMAEIPELAKLKLGQCFIDKGFMSTSKDVEVAKSFNAGAVLSIETDAAISISDYSSIKKEKEYILLPNTALKLMAIPEKLDSGKLFTLREVELSECGKVANVQIPATIKITKAFYAGQEVTDKVQKFCDLKSTCDYKISEKFLGDMNWDTDRSFHVEWQCRGYKTNNVNVIPGPATNIKFEFGCKPDGTKFLN